MKDEHDKYTFDFCASRGKRSVGRQRKYPNNAAKVAAYRARKNKKSLTVLVAPELVNKLDAFMLARDETKSEVVERALQYFFRKR